MTTQAGGKEQGKGKDRKWKGGQEASSWEVDGGLAVVLLCGEDEVQGSRRCHGHREGNKSLWPQGRMGRGAWGRSGVCGVRQWMGALGWMPQWDTMLRAITEGVAYRLVCRSMACGGTWRAKRGTASERTCVSVAMGASGDWR